MKYKQVLGYEQFNKKVNMGDCSATYFDKKEWNKAVEKMKQKKIPKGKKLILDPFAGYILIDK